MAVKEKALLKALEDIVYLANLQNVCTVGKLYDKAQDIACSAVGAYYDSDDERPNGELELKYSGALLHIRELEYKLGFALLNFEQLKSFVGEEVWHNCLEAEQEKWLKEINNAKTK